MSQAAEIIAALLARKHVIVFDRRTGMLPGWGIWMRRLHERLGEVPRARRDALLAHLAAQAPRPVRPGRRRPTRWQLLASVFRAGWEPPMREERGLRWLAGASSLLMHLLFALLLVLVALVRVPVPMAESSEETRVRVDFMGAGTIEEQGGGAPAAAGQVHPAPAASARATEAPAPSVASAPPRSAPASLQPAPLEQVLQVTETDSPAGQFLLPPPTPVAPEWQPPNLEAPDLAVPQREVVLVTVPRPSPAVPLREVAAPDLPAPALQVRERVVVVPLPQVRAPQLPARELPAPVLSRDIPAVRQATIAAPPSPAAAPVPAARPVIPTPSQAGAAAATAANPVPSGGARASPASSGPTPTPRTGGGPAPVRGDDWGAASAAGPGGDGGSSGLFNADGSVRLPGGLGTDPAPAAGPPGSRQAQRRDADRAGQWLERPQVAYEPTMFDEYWKPANESLLAEWVRRSVREVEIPIPGTSKKVRCVVSVLQAGGACSLFDLNLNEQPATARPPPDIPVKRTPIPTDS